MRLPKSQLRVLHIASGDLWGGAEAQVLSLLKGICFDKSVNAQALVLNNGLLKDRLLSAGIPVHVVDESSLSPILQVLRVIRIVRAFQPEVIHSHRLKENVFAVIASIFVRNCHCVCTAHGASEHNPSFWQFRKKFIRMFERVVLKMFFIRAVAVSSELRDKLVEKVSPRKLRVISNGVDIDSLLEIAGRQVSIPGSASSVKIAFVGRLVPVKRLDIFIKIADQLIRQGRSQFDFYVFGEGPEQGVLLEMVKGENLVQQVHIMGFKEDLAAFLKKMDILLICSDHEGLPINLLEALALDVFVVSHAVGGIVEVLSGTGYGALIESQDPNCYSQAILEYALNDNFRSDQALKLIQENYSSIQTARNYIAMYRELV